MSERQGAPHPPRYKRCCRRHLAPEACPDRRDRPARPGPPSLSGAAPGPGSRSLAIAAPRGPSGRRGGPFPQRSRSKAARCLQREDSVNARGVPRTHLPALAAAARRGAQPGEEPPARQGVVRGRGSAEAPPPPSAAAARPSSEGGGKRRWRSRRCSAAVPLGPGCPGARLLPPARSAERSPARAPPPGRSAPPAAGARPGACGARARGRLAGPQAVR